MRNTRVTDANSSLFVKSYSDEPSDHNVDESPNSDISVGEGSELHGTAELHEADVARFKQLLYYLNSF